MIALLLVSGGLIGILPLILMIAAVIFLAIATFWAPAAPLWNRLVSGGLLCWAGAVLLQTVGGLM